MSATHIAEQEVARLELMLDKRRAKVANAETKLAAARERLAETRRPKRNRTAASGGDSR